jgi:hypothetical protein
MNSALLVSSSLSATSVSARLEALMSTHQLKKSGAKQAVAMLHEAAGDSYVEDGAAGGRPRWQPVPIAIG